MLTLDAGRFIMLMHSLLAGEQMIRGVSGELPDNLRSRLPQIAEDLKNQCSSLELVVSAKTADGMLSTASSGERLHEAVRTLFNNIALELQDRKFYGPLSRYSQYYDSPKLFGESVFEKFPSANDDIYEAGACLALERSTACVMHLMRVVEVGLRCLANEMGVGHQNDWGSYLREIDKELARRMKTSGARSADEQFFSEAHIGFEGMKRAWRNSTMHPEKTYSQDRAEEILTAVRSFMRHLATNISE
jgi:hypothetical protein